MTELARAWHPGARVARVRASHSYGLVLALIGVSFVFMSVAPNRTWADSVLLLLQSITLVTALWTSGVARTDSTLSLSLVALAGLAALGLLVFGGNGFASAVGLLSGVLTVATIGTVALGVVDQGEANVRAVTGAVCVYVLIGLLFVFLYLEAKARAYRVKMEAFAVTSEETAASAPAQDAAAAGPHARSDLASDAASNATFGPSVGPGETSVDDDHVDADGESMGLGERRLV